MSFFYKILKKVSRKLALCSTRLRTAFYKPLFKQMNGLVYGFNQLEGAQYISVGKQSVVHKNCILTAWDAYGSQSFTPSIEIGDNVRIGEDNQISSCNKVVIGNGVLTGRRVYISDNAHGQFLKNQLDIPPIERPLYSKGPVVIGDNVWIGERACIMAGVTIGAGAIVAANAVVTHDVPAQTLVAGVPAKVVRFF